MPCNPDDLAQVQLLELLDEEERLPSSAAVVDIASVAADEMIFNAGDSGDRCLSSAPARSSFSSKTLPGRRSSSTSPKRTTFLANFRCSTTGRGPRTGLALIDTELFVLDRDDLLLLFQKKPDSALNMLAAMSTMLRKADNLLRTRVSRNVNEEMEEKLSTLQRIADWIAWFSGSMQFLIVNRSGSWSGSLSTRCRSAFKQFDPFPFGLLTMIVSLEAIFLSCFVLISQNRQAEKDHIRSDIEYEVNIKAEKEVAHLHEKMDHIHEQMLERFSDVENLVKDSNV